MEDQVWTPFCRRRQNYEHAIDSKDDLSCPYCGQANPNRIGQNPVRPSTPQDKRHHYSIKKSHVRIVHETPLQEVLQKDPEEDAPMEGNHKSEDLPNSQNKDRHQEQLRMPLKKCYQSKLSKP